ncbi:MAG: hypothetical protein ABI439_01490 [Rhodospirillales bacterium]
MRIVLSLLVALTLSISFIAAPAQAAGKADLVNSMVDSFDGF